MYIYIYIIRVSYIYIVYLTQKNLPESSILVCKKLTWDCTEACWKVSCDLMTRQPPGGKLRAPYPIRVPMTQGGQSISKYSLESVLTRPNPACKESTKGRSRNCQRPLWGWHNNCPVAMAHASFLGATAALWAKITIHERAQLTFRLLWWLLPQACLQKMANMLI